MKISGRAWELTRCAWELTCCKRKPPQYSLCLESNAGSRTKTRRKQDRLPSQEGGSIEIEQATQGCSQCAHLPEGSQTCILGRSPDDSSTSQKRRRFWASRLRDTQRLKKTFSFSAVYSSVSSFDASAIESFSVCNSASFGSG
jgi:hypothetical protein